MTSLSLWRAFACQRDMKRLSWLGLLLLTACPQVRSPADAGCATGLTDCGFGCVAASFCQPSCIDCDYGDSCGGVRTSLQTDPANCGMCGRQCTQGECRKGICAPTVLVGCSGPGRARAVNFAESASLGGPVLDFDVTTLAQLSGNVVLADDVRQELVVQSTRLPIGVGPTYLLTFGTSLYVVSGDAGELRTFQLGSGLDGGVLDLVSTTALGTTAGPFAQLSHSLWISGVSDGGAREVLQVDLADLSSVAASVSLPAHDGGTLPASMTQARGGVFLTFADEEGWLVLLETVAGSPRSRLIELGPTCHQPQSVGDFDGALAVSCSDRVVFLNDADQVVRTWTSAGVQHPGTLLTLGERLVVGDRINGRLDVIQVGDAGPELAFPTLRPCDTAVTALLPGP